MKREGEINRDTVAFGLFKRRPFPNVLLRRVRIVFFRTTADAHASTLIALTKLRDRGPTLAFVLWWLLLLLLLLLDTASRDRFSFLSRLAGGKTTSHRLCVHAHVLIELVYFGGEDGKSPVCMTLSALVSSPTKSGSRSHVPSSTAIPGLSLSLSLSLRLVSPK